MAWVAKWQGGPNGKGRWRAMPFDPRLAMPNGMPSMGSYWSILEKLCEAIHAIWHAKWGMPNGKSMPNDKPTNHRPPFVHLPNGMKPKWHESIRLHTSSGRNTLRAKIYEKAKEKQKKKDSHFSSMHTLVDNLLVSFFFLLFLFCNSSSLCLSFHRSFYSLFSSSLLQPPPPVPFTVALSHRCDSHAHQAKNPLSPTLTHFARLPSRHAILILSPILSPPFRVQSPYPRVTVACRRTACSGSMSAGSRNCSDSTTVRSVRAHGAPLVPTPLPAPALARRTVLQKASEALRENADPQTCNHMHPP